MADLISVSLEPPFPLLSLPRWGVESIFKLAILTVANLASAFFRTPFLTSNMSDLYYKIFLIMHSEIFLVDSRSAFLFSPSFTQLTSASLRFLVTGCRNHVLRLYSF